MIIDSPIISGSTSATGSLNQVGNVVITGSLTVTGPISGALTGSVDSASYAASATSASYAVSATSSSYAINASYLNNSGSGEFVPTGSFNTFSSSILTYTGSNNTNISNIHSTTASLNTASGSAITRLNALEVTSGSNITRISALEVASGSAITRLNALESASGSAITRLNSIESTTGSLNTASGSAITRLNSIESTTGSLNTASGSAITRLSSLESKTGSYATTGSNTFVDGQYISASYNPTGFSTTASLYTDGGLRVGRDAYISGTLYLNNVTVYGTQSISYITSSQLNISTNLITVNTDTPSVRFGGLSVYDSGSTGLTGSILWDSENNHWVYSNPSGSSYSGGMFISGPRSAALGSETGTTACRILVGQGGDHLTSSLIYHDSATTCIPNTLIGSTICASAFAGGTVSGTTGAFSSCITAGARSFITGTAGYLFDIQTTEVNKPRFQVYVDDVNGVDLISGYDTTAKDLRFSTGGNIRAIITSTGIACFACQVCAPLFISSGTICSTGNTCFGGMSVINSCLGIGTSTPEYKLDVNGTGRFTAPSGTQENIIAKSANTGFSKINIDSVTGASSQLAFLENGTQKGVVGYRPSTCNVFLANATGDILTISCTGTSAFSGNVGINGGTTTSPLTIKVATNQNVRVSSETSTSIQAVNDAANAYVVLKVDGSCLLLNTQSGGNVGIGTSTPEAKLQVYGNMQIYAGSSGNSDPLIFGGETGAPKKAIFLENFWMVYQGHDNEGHKFRSVSASGACTDDMIITGGGNVSIGTNTPSSTYGRLTVAGTGISIADDGNAKLQIGRYNASACNAYIKMGTNACSLRFTNAADTVDVVVMEKGGNVGIGVTPSAWDTTQTRTLELGTIGNYISGYVGSSVVYLGTNSYLASDGWKYARTGVVAGQIDMGGGQFRFLNATSGTAGCAISWNQAMIINSSSNVGIGASVNPQNLLEVSSTGGSPRIRVGTLQNNDNTPRFEVITSNGVSVANSAWLKVNDAGGFTLGQSDYTKAGGDSGNFACLSSEVEIPRITVTSAGIACFAGTVCVPRLEIRGQQTIITNSEYQLDVQSSTSGAGASIRRYSTSVYAYDVYETTGRHWRTGILGSNNYSIYDNTIQVERVAITTTGIACFACYICTPSIYLTCSVDAKICVGSGIGLNIDGSALYLNRYTNSSIVAGGSIIPLCNGKQDLGSSTCRWCTVYTSDLSLNNGIGNYTIVEGENDLFLYNNNSCKVYKFIIQEVCPEIAPAKRSI